jgi:hypothetical protein
MKHALTALALSVFVAGVNAQSPAPAPAPVAASTTDLSLRGSASWSAKNVFRGIERSSTDGLFQAAVTLDYSVPGLSGASLYANFFNADALERTYTFGARKDYGFGEADLGFQRMTAPTARTIGADGFTQLTNNSEVYAGVSFANVALKPSLYAYYSLDLQQFTLEASGSKSFPGSSIGLSGFDIVTKVYGGLSDASASTLAAKNSYGYLGASLDLTRQVGRGAELGVGANWAYNTDSQVKTSGSSVWTRVFANFRF